MSPAVHPFATKASSCIGADRWRLGYAVAASVIAHVAVVIILPEDVPTRGGGPGSARSLTINLAAPAESPMAIAPHQSDPVPEALEVHPPPDSPLPADLVAKARNAARAIVPDEAIRAALPPMTAEPAYYAAHELDIFPRLSEPPGPDDATPNGVPRPRVRLELLIGADGMVRKVSVLDANSSDASAVAARAMWMAARFDPARKAGRAVASRIQLEVDYEPPGPR